jgi:hypothetical protein
MDEEYIGDGLYVSFDGWEFCLRAPRENGDHVVYLEPQAVRYFNDFVQRATAPRRTAQEN